MKASEATKIVGGCLCGAVRFTVEPEQREVGACHCDMCLRWSAGPFLNVDCGDRVNVGDAAALQWYRSSDWAERGFCGTCGSTLFYRLVGREHYFVSSGALDDTAGFDFTLQIFIDEKPHYYDFANKTKNMTGAEVAAAFAGDDGQVNG